MENLPEQSYEPSNTGLNTFATDSRSSGSLAVPRVAGNLNDGQSYERKLLLFVAASLSQNEEVEDYWIVSNPTGIDKIDDVVARISFKDSEKKDIAVFIQAKLTSPDKLLWLKTVTNKTRPTKYCYEIKLTEYKKAFEDIIQMMSGNQPETEELRKLLGGVDIKDYFVCIFTNMKNVDPILKCTQFDADHPIYFLDTRKCGQYRQFDLENENFNSNFFKQLYVFLGQPSFEDIDYSIAQLLGEEYKHRMANLDEIVKDFMQRNKFCWVLTKQTFEMNWFKVLAMDWMHVDFANVEEINPKFVRLWQKLLEGQKVVNILEQKIWPLLAYYYQCVIIQEVDENFEWQTGMTLSIKDSIKQKYSEDVTDLRQLLFLLWRERKLPLAIRSDCTRNILKFRDQFKTVEGGFVVFTSEECLDVVTDVKQISDEEVLEEVMQLEVSLQGRPPVTLSDIGEWQTFGELKIAQLLAWTNNLEDGRHHIVGPVLPIPDENYITRTFRRKQHKAQYIQKQTYSIYVKSSTTSALKQSGMDDGQLREILTVEDVVKLTRPGLHIITGEPGMGKSMVLEELAHKCCSKDFVIFVILRDCLEDIEDDDTWPRIEADPIQYFFNKMAGESDDIISGSIFQNHKTGKRICLFLDGFDEILPMHGKKLSSLIVSILDKFAIPIFCTTRPYGEDQITKNSVTIFLELSRFDSKQIQRYLKKIKIDGTINNVDDTIFSNPLHLHMMLQMFKASKDPNHITFGQIYKSFIELKHTTYNEKVGWSRNNARRQTERSMMYHRLLALVDIFGRECVISKGLMSVNIFDKILEDIGEHNIGIVKVSKSKGKFRFHHRTFAEYLVADWLLHMANQGSLNKPHIKYFYEEVIHKYITIYVMLSGLNSGVDRLLEPSKLHINSDLFKLDEFGKNIAHTIAFNDEAYSVLSRSPSKSRLFYRMDTVLQRTCREFFHKKPNAVVKEINEDYPSRTPLTNDKWSNDTCTKLLTAVDSENFDAIMSILTPNPSLLETGLGIIAFHSAITTGNESIVRLFLDLRPLLLNEEDCNQFTALHIACAVGCSDIVVLLLDKHVSLDIVNQKTWSPIEVAAAEGQLEIVSLLLDHIRERIDANGHGSSTEHIYMKTVTIACKNGRWDVVTWLIEHGADPTQSDNNGWAVMHFAAQKGQLEILALLLEKGVNVNAKTDKGERPLYIAIEFCHVDTTIWLLEHDADPTLSDDHGCVAVHYAAKAGQLEILTLLLERGLNVNAKTNWGQTPLYFAIEFNHLDTTKWLLEHGGDPTLSTDNGWVAMHYAAKKGQLEMLTFLLKGGLNVNAKNNGGWTPLVIAIYYDHQDSTKLLLEQGADPTLSTAKGSTAMHVAAQKGQLEILTLLLENGLNVNAKTNTGETPLHIAIENKHLDTATWLLEHGADPTLSNDNGSVAMHFAAQKGHLEILTLLLERELNVNAATNTGTTPLHIAVQSKHLDTAKWLLEHGADPTLSTDTGSVAMHYAAKTGQLEMLTLLLKRGLNVNAKNNGGWTPLDIAIYYDHQDSTKLLLEHGADPTLLADKGWTALHYAAKKGHLEILTLLLKRGFNVNAKTNRGCTPLYIALENNRLDSVKWLLDHGADATLSNDTGSVIMHYAAKKGQIEMLTLLLERGFNVNAKTNTGATPLHIAIQNNHVDTTKWLLEHGADPTLSTNRGSAAMHFAAQRGQLEILTLLLEKGLNVNAKTNRGATPLHIAIKNNHLDTSKWLLDHGGDPTLSDHVGWAAIHYAVFAEGQILALLAKEFNLDMKSNTGEMLLTVSIDHHCWKSAKWLLNHGANPKLATDNGWTAIHNAVKEGQLEIFTLLLEKGLSINSKPNMGETLFAIAITSKHYDTVKWLLNHGVDPALLDEDGWSAMHYAAIEGHLEILSLLFETGSNVNAETDIGETPLIISIDNEHWDSVKWLLDHGANSTLSDEDGWTAMHYAASKGQLDMLDLLFPRVLNVNAKTNMGETLLTIAITSKHFHTVEWLLDHGADPTLLDEEGWSAMHYAAKTGTLEVLSLLLNWGLNLNTKSNAQETPLTISIDNDHWDCVRWLLLLCADPTLFDEDGWSAMHYAAKAGKRNILSLLVDSGLNVNAKSDTGETPFSISIDSDHWDTVKWLLEYGADHRLSRDDGWSSIHFAAKRGQLEILIILLDRGVNVNVRTNMSETPLTIAINYKHCNTAMLLLELGADPTLLDEDGWSAMHFAAKRGHMEILGILLDRRVNINAETNTGETPLTIACKYEHWDIVYCLVEYGAQLTTIYETEA